jgi:hypothetical protein
MRTYTLSTILSFGKFKGKTLLEVLEIQPSYIDWCVINLEHFFLPSSAIDAILSLKPSFSFSIEGEKALKLKKKQFIKEFEEQGEGDFEPDWYNNNTYENNPSVHSNPYYNDGLDMDQQSPEFWDSL